MRDSTPLAVLADIHGNAAALAAVLNHAGQRGLTRFVNLGDTFYGPLDPAGTWAILRRLDMPAVLGNQDRILLDNAPQPAAAGVRDQIGPDGLAWLAALPKTLRLEPDILLCHGTPRNDAAYLLEDVSSGLPAPRDPDSILADLLPEADGCTLVLAGHSHHPGRAMAEGITVVNPGSVGLPAYRDDDPPHAMVAGSPKARYAVVRRTGHGWEAEFSTVDYDWQSAAETARDNGREDWAEWLSTGLA
ncbi:metallophosphoesterase family protein [Pseudodesulfovibrio thermohalotolerans]|uniref:metallophosphoesterase family protein n=1 Tax=Pseudodesulfovibrio thermohalotolerans TaxID=2880651 RepID=UPI0024421266|nr:metallophosphoesterase family protein [Pseudodesulfovibrio thermohalotolerans]WFS62905.1 metallophosphoesterase family protein [Pseudodesulfovibrio thermohalotolerans]